MEGEGEQPENDFTIKTIVSFLIGMGTNRTSLLYPLTGRRNDQDMSKWVGWGGGATTTCFWRHPMMGRRGPVRHGRSSLRKVRIGA